MGLCLKARGLKFDAVFTSALQWLDLRSWFGVLRFRVSGFGFRGLTVWDLGFRGLGFRLREYVVNSALQWLGPRSCGLPIQIRLCILSWRPLMIVNIRMIAVIIHV